MSDASRNLHRALWYGTLNTSKAPFDNARLRPRRLRDAILIQESLGKIGIKATVAKILTSGSARMPAYVNRASARQCGFAREGWSG